MKFKYLLIASTFCLNATTTFASPAVNERAKIKDPWETVNMTPGAAVPWNQACDYRLAFDTKSDDNPKFEPDFRLTVTEGSCGSIAGIISETIDPKSGQFGSEILEKIMRENYVVTRYCVEDGHVEAQFPFQKFELNNGDHLEKHMPRYDVPRNRVQLERRCEYENLVTEPIRDLPESVNRSSGGY